MGLNRNGHLHLFLSTALFVGCGPSGTTIGPSGGTVRGEGEVSVTIPAGALDDEVAISITRSPVTHPGALGPAFQFEPEGLVFKRPVQVTLPYTPSRNIPADAIEPVFVFRAPGGTDRFMSLGGTVIAPGQVQAETSGFSVYVAGKATPALVAGQQNYPKGIAVNSTHVYWTNHGMSSQQLTGDQGLVMRAPLGGGTPQVFASGQVDPKKIVLDNSNAYWTNGGSGPTAGDAGIMKASLSGGAPTRIVQARFPIDIAVNSHYVFWSDADLRTINRAKPNGAMPTVLAMTGARPEAIAIDSANVYWVCAGARGGADGVVMQVPIGGGTAVTLASGQAEPGGLAVDGSHVYWVNRGDGKVQRVPIGGGQVQLLRQMTRPNAIAVDASYYYVGDILPGMVIRYPKAGGTGQVRSSNEGHPNDIVLDANNIYWVNDGVSKFLGNVQVINKSP
jgi:hypothetical protein